MTPSAVLSFVAQQQKMLCFRRCAAAVWVFLLLAASKAKAQILPPTQLYLHTDGLELNVSFQGGQGCIPGLEVCGISDARTNTSWLPETREEKIKIAPMEYERFGPNPKLVRAALLAEVRSLLEGINLKVVNRRPKPGTRYSMVVVGGSPGDIGLSSNIAGLAPLDCGDKNPWDITFVFSQTLKSIDAVARVTVQEAAHSYGIEHVRAPEYVMNPEPIGGAMGLGKSCLPLDPSPGLSNPDGIKCLHACQDPSYQNSFTELQDLFGATPIPRSAPAPRIQIRYPEPGNHFFQAPIDLRLDVDILNPEDLTHVELQLNDSDAIRNEMYPYAFRLHALKAGRYRATVSAHDIHGHRSEQSVKFSVGPKAEPSSSYPSVSNQQISLRYERLTGEPVRCTSDRVCYGGTSCQDGLCLRSVNNAGCHLAKEPPQRPWLWLSVGLLLATGMRRTRRPRSPGSNRLGHGAYGRRILQGLHPLSR